MLIIFCVNRCQPSRSAEQKILTKENSKIFNPPFIWHATFTSTRQGARANFLYCIGIFNKTSIVCGGGHKTFGGENENIGVETE